MDLIRVKNVDGTIFVNENDFFENFRFIKIIDGVIYKNYVPEMEGYGDYLDDYCIPLEFGLPEYTVEEIKEMRYYSVEELKTALSTVADVVQYIVETDFADNNRNADILFNLGGYKWQTGESPEICLKHQVSGCAGMSNLFRYILEDDYDEEGYMGYGNRNLKNSSGGGHVFNYFKKDGMILTFDFTGCRYDSFGVDNFQYVANEFSEMAPFFEEVNEMQKEMDTGAVFFLFFAEKDVHRDSAPRAGAAPSGKLTMSLSSQYKDEIEVIYFDESFVKEHYDFESLFIDVEISEERIASEIERAYQNVEVPDRSYSPTKITLKINEFEINTYSGFRIGGNPLVAYVLADGVPVSDYEVSFNGNIGTVEKQEDGSLLLNAKKKGQQEFYITYKGEKVYFNLGVDENSLGNGKETVSDRISIKIGQHETKSGSVFRNGDYPLEATVMYDGKAITDYEVEIGDPNLAFAEKGNDGKLLLYGKEIGKCKFYITYGEEQGVFTWEITQYNLAH